MATHCPIGQALARLLDELDAAKKGYLADTHPPARYISTSHVKRAEADLKMFVIRHGRTIVELLP